MIKTLLACVALALATEVYAGGTARWDPFIFPNGGWRYSDGSTSRYDQFIFPNGGYRFSNGGTVRWDPFIFPNGGWRYED